mmetsp:Transcript_22641/g.90736  ORF Transcript_22641/g.90736 Transcript_22641/m.90736 type:complete len:89 (+) Transcript_22641:184-450(+)
MNHKLIGLVRLVIRLALFLPRFKKQKLTVPELLLRANSTATASFNGQAQRIYLSFPEHGLWSKMELAASASRWDRSRTSSGWSSAKAS